jgi:hypothetical protein
MLGNEFAEFVDEDLEEEIDAGPPAVQLLPGPALSKPHLCLQPLLLPQLLILHPLGS